MTFWAFWAGVFLGMLFVNGVYVPLQAVALALGVREGVLLFRQWRAAR